MDKVKILAADEDTLFREGVCALLRGYEDIEVVGEASQRRRVQMEPVLDVAKVQSVIDNCTEKVDSLVDSYADKKGQLISLLQDIQSEFNYLPKDALIRASQKLNIPLSQVFGVVTFFKAFSLEPRGRHLVTVCLGTACHVSGGPRLVDKIERDYAVKPGETTEDTRFTLETINCLGCCTLSPVVVVDGEYEAQMNPDKLGRVLRRYK